MDRPYTHSDFVRMVLTEFPELADDFRATDEYPRLQMSAFAHRMQRAKGEGDWSAYERGVRLTTVLWMRPDHDLHSEIGFTLMKALDFKGARGPLAWECWPAELRLAWSDAQEKLSALAGPPENARRRHR